MCTCQVSTFHLLPTLAQFPLPCGWDITPRHKRLQKVQTLSACTCWELRGSLNCILRSDPSRSYIGSGAEISWPAAAAHSNSTNNLYNLTFNPVISFYNFLNKIYQALHFASPTSLSLSRTSGSGIAVVHFYLDISSASPLPGPLQRFSSTWASL